MTESFDVVVIGLGPGGEEVANRLARAGLSVLGVEAGLVGGECPYFGCIPSKTMVRASDALGEAARVDVLAGRAHLEADWAPVARRIAEVTADWDDAVAAERLAASGATLWRGSGRLVGPGEVEVGERRARASRAIVVATGAQPFIPPIPGLSEVEYWTNREVVRATTLPATLAIVGGGAIALEIGQAVARFGTAVTIVEAAPRLLALEEPESSALVAAALERDGLVAHTGAQLTGIAKTARGARLEVADAAAIEVERVLVATGRRVDLSRLGIEAIGLDPSLRALPTDGRQRVAPGVWAVGDVTGVGAFTHVAMYQARLAIADILGEPAEPASYHALSRVTFTDPEIGAVGLTEAQARESGRQVRVALSELPQSSRGYIHQVGNEGFIKLVADEDAGVLVGATSAGPCGGEVLGLLALAVHAAVPLRQLRELIYAYPTFHRAIEPAVAQLVDPSGD